MTSKVLHFLKGLGEFRSLVKWRFGALPIRVKLVIVIGLLFIVLTSIFSFILVQRGKMLLNDRLTETCKITLLHVSQEIKEDLSLYNNPEADENSRSGHVGHIREAILALLSEKIKGLAYAGVIDRNGIIIAHTELDRINAKVTKSDSLLFRGLGKTFVRENNTIIEYIFPLFARKASDNPVLLGVTVIGFSKNIILKPIRQATRSILLITILITLLAIAIIFYLARRMTRQIDAMTAGVRRISQGNLNEKIPVMSKDELGRLAKEFNIMTIHLREKMQMQKFVSKLTVEMIKEKSQLENLQPEGENRVVTLLFSDIRSFSALTEQLGAGEIVKLINIYLDLQARIVEENDGIVDKFIGDQVMAIFLGEDQADRAIHTAVEIQRSIRELNKRRSQRGEVVLRVGCGVNIGDVVMGNMGSKSRLDYTVIGDVVNLSARLCAIAKPDQIIAPIEMVDKLSGDYPTIRLNPVWIKGRSQPLEVLEVDYDHAIIM
ncbi:MAG: HAMP domain-containing protein [Actinobacteria bacterium]|nr:HAMP domain-containing protein [Actinomycetota bacterium]